MAEEGKGKGGSNSDQELDDWASAIDEWDANLALPAADAKKKAAEAEAALPSLSDKQRSSVPTPAMGFGTHDPSLPLPPPPHGDEGSDPLMQLFDGDMELPEEAGQALGSLLGVDQPQTMVAPIGSIEKLLQADAPDEPGLYSEQDFGGAESTRVANVDEFDKLLADTAAVVESAVMEMESEPPPTPPPARPSRQDVSRPGSFSGGSTRVAQTGEVEALLADDVDIEKNLPAVPSSAPFASPLLPEPGSKLPSGRFPAPGQSGRFPAPTPPPRATPSGAFKSPSPSPSPSGRFPIPTPAGGVDQPKPLPKPPLLSASDLEVEMELGPAVEPIAAPPAHAPVDEDFYDDIEVMPARDEPSRRASQPRRPTPRPPIEEESDPLFDLPIAVDGGSSPELRMRDPDRTPLPIAREDAESIAGVVPVPLEVVESRPIIAERLVAPPRPMEAMSLPELAKVKPLDASYLRDQLALYDTERLLTPNDEPGRVARLAHAAGRIAERLGDVAAAIERYEAAIEAEPNHAHALRGLRRLRLADGKREPVLQLLEREIAQAAPGEKRGLFAWRAELALAMGERDAARSAFGSILIEQPGDLGALSGLCDLAAATGDDDELNLALGNLQDALSAATDGPTKAALLVERGRLDEAAGRVREAVSRFREALDVDPTSVPAAWGLWRVAVRTPGPHDDVDTYARLVERLPVGPLRHALERRLGQVRARVGDVAAARPALMAASADGDRVALGDLVELERNDGRLEEAAQALARVIEDEPDAGRRADRLVLLGELAEKQGNVAQAANAYSRAAQDFPDDPRAARALERAQAAGGDKESALKKHLDAAERNRARAPMELTYAARLLRELGRTDEARARLQAALTVSPALGPAVDLAVELELGAAQPDRAAEILARAADAVDEPGVAQALRMRAARLLGVAGRAGDALALVQPLMQSLGGTDAARPLRWLEQRILRQAAGQADQLNESLRAEAETSELAGDKRRAAALAYELALIGRNSGDDGAVEQWKRVLSLDATQSGAALELAARVFPDRERRAAELPSLLQSRLRVAEDRPESVALGLRLGEALLEDAQDPAAAERAFSEARRVAPDYIPTREGLDRVARHSDDAAAQLAALEREANDTESPEQRFALDIVIGERIERGQLAPERAAERYRHALELRPQHPIARQALERALKSARNYAALADLALADLKEAPDPHAKVRAYERLAFIDGELRGEPQSALLGFESIIEVDHAHHAAMRVLEKHYLQEQTWAELVALYEQIGLTAQDPAFAVAIHLDRARLRRRMGTEASASDIETAVDNDYRLALFKDRRSRPALRHVYARARAAHDLPQMADMAAALAEAVGDDARTASVMLTRAAEALVESAGPPSADPAAEGRRVWDDARTRYQQALERSPAHVPALVGLVDFALATGDFSLAAQTAERAGQALRDPAARSRYWLIAGSLAQNKLDERPRAVEDLRQALSADPRSNEAFSRLEHLLRELSDFNALAQLYQDRLKVETDGGRLMALHLLLARIFRDELKDRDRARAELKSVLSQDPQHPEALQALADLQFEDKQWAEAAETLIRRARAEKSRTALKDIFFKLGIIYSEHLPDPEARRALPSRACLQVTPDDLVALEQLSNLHLKEWEWKGALQATMRLAELERDKHRRVTHLHRVAKIYEEGFKDARHALDALRRALELDPMWMPSIGELAKFFDRQSDVQSMRVHLDRTTARVRQLLDHNPLRRGRVSLAVQGVLCGGARPIGAAIAAGVLDWLGAAEPEEKTQLVKLTGRDNYPGSSLADPTLDETLFDARVPAGFRNLFRLLDERAEQDVPRRRQAARRAALRRSCRARATRCAKRPIASPAISAFATSIST